MLQCCNVATSFFPFTIRPFNFPSTSLSKHFNKFFHAFGCTRLEVRDAEGGVVGHVGGVDEVDFAGRGSVVQESCGGIDDEGGADDHEDVSLTDFVDGRFDHGDGFAKPDDGGAQL